MTSGTSARRIHREQHVVAQMIRIYCRSHHAHTPRHSIFQSNGSHPLCPECEELLVYARTRLSRCPHGNGKPSCRRCTIHCYTPLMRERIRIVMRSVGPRMLLVSPITAIRHLIDELT